MDSNSERSVRRAPQPPVNSSLPIFARRIQRVNLGWTHDVYFTILLPPHPNPSPTPSFNPTFSLLQYLSFFLDPRAIFTLGGASLSGRTQAGVEELEPGPGGPSEVGSEFWRMTAPRVLGLAAGVGTAGSGSWDAGKAARFRVGWSCRDWDRGTGAAYGFSGTRCATRLCRERPGKVDCLFWGTS